jgi:hypothetical protein
VGSFVEIDFIARVARASIPIDDAREPADHRSHRGRGGSAEGLAGTAPSRPVFRCPSNCQRSVDPFIWIWSRGWLAGFQEFGRLRKEFLGPPVGRSTNVPSMAWREPPDLSTRPNSEGIRGTDGPQTRTPISVATVWTVPADSSGLTGRPRQLMISAPVLDPSALGEPSPTKRWRRRAGPAFFDPPARFFIVRTGRVTARGGLRAAVAMGRERGWLERIFRR